MNRKKSFDIFIALTLFIGFGFACDFTRYSEGIAGSNCSSAHFVLLCQEERECRHISLETLSVRYYNDVSNETISCMIPRILAGKVGFVQCKNFENNYQCFAGSPSLSRSSVCYNSACSGSGGRTIALDAGPGFKCRSNNTYCVLPQVLLYDNVKDCERGEDLCFDGSYSALDGRCSRCADGSIIPSSALCDGIIDCPDLSDECRCQNPISICDAVTPILSNLPLQCFPGQIQCGNGKCIDRSKICDGNVDCTLNQIDERSEYCGASLFCRELQLEKVEQECLCTGLQCETPTNCTLPQVAVTTKRNASNTCRDFGKTESTGKRVFCDLVKDAALFGRKCNHIVECETTAMDEEGCFGRFVCRGFDDRDFSSDGVVSIAPEQDALVKCGIYSQLNLEQNLWMISISQREVCDFTVHCSDGSDELNCSDQRFYCKSNNLSFVKLNQVRNGRVDCEDGSDECVENDNSTNTYFFHTTRQLIGNQVLYVIVWLMAFMALMGNSIVIVRQIMKMLKMRRRIENLSSLKANHILVMNLALADLLMGVYLLAVGIAYEKLNGSYCKEELVWRGSSVCTWMGVTAIVSIQASVLTLLLLTTCRFYAVLQPFKTTSMPRTWFVLLLLFFLWGMSLLVAGIPLTEAFQSKVPEIALLPDNPFVDEPMLDLTTAKKFLLDSLVYYPTQNVETLRELAKEVESANTWSALEGIHESLPEQRQELMITARYGYYNVHSICLADFFPRWEDPYVALSMSLVIFNFLAFIYIAAVYVAIYLISFKNKRACNETCDSVKMQKKIFRIVAFNFLSWIPICLLSFIRLGDPESRVVNGEVYQVAAIILLPLNSSINPILYSDITSIVLRKMCGFADDFKKRTIRLTSIDASLSTTKSTLDRPK